MTAEEFKTMAVTQVFMGKVLGLSQSRISQLLDEKILVRDEESRRILIFESLRNYYLSKATTEDGVNFWKERSLHERAKRKMAELKLRREQGELYWARDVDNFIAELILTARSKLLGLGHKLSPRLDGLRSAAICAIIDEEITEILEELAKNGENIAAEMSVEDVGAAAEVDG